MTTSFRRPPSRLLPIGSLRRGETAAFGAPIISYHTRRSVTDSIFSKSSKVQRRSGSVEHQPAQLPCIVFVAGDIGSSQVRADTEIALGDVGRLQQLATLSG